MVLLKRVFNIVMDLFFREQTPLEKWAEEVERDADDRGELPW